MFRKGREVEGVPDEESKYEAGFDDDGRLERDPEGDMVVRRGRDLLRVLPDGLFLRLKLL